MQTCISHSKGAEVNKPSSGFIPVSVVLIPLSKIRSWKNIKPYFAWIYFAGGAEEGSVYDPRLCLSIFSLAVKCHPKHCLFKSWTFILAKRLSQIFIFARGKQLGWFSLLGHLCFISIVN